MFLRHSLCELRVSLNELFIALLCRLACHGEDTALVGNEGILEKNAEEALEFRYMQIQGFVGRFFHLEDLGIFHGLYVHGRGGVRNEALQIGDPPILDRQKRRVFRSVKSIMKSAHTSADNEHFDSAYFTLLKDKLSLPKPSMNKNGPEIVRFIFRQINMTAYVSEDDVEFRLGDHGQTQFR